MAIQLIIIGFGLIVLGGVFAVPPMLDLYARVDWTRTERLSRERRLRIGDWIAFSGLVILAATLAFGK